MADALPPPEDGSQRPAKKSFFKKPSWQKSEVKPASAADDATEFFSRRSNFQDVLAEQEIRRKEKITKKLEETEKRKSDETINLLARDGKRRRIDEQSGEDTSDGELSDSDRSKEEHGRIGTRKRDREQISPRKQKSASQESPRDRYNKLGKRSEPIPIFSDPETDEGDTHQSSKRRSQNTDKSPVEESIEDGDSKEDYNLGILEAKFREWQRQRELNAEKSVPSSSNGDALPLSNPDAAATSNLSVQVLVTSPIPGTEPILFKLYLTQRLGHAKDTWCKYCKLSDALASSIFLTHNNKRVYDVTTAKALGVTADNIDEMGKLHLVAVTPQLFEEMKTQAVQPESVARNIEADDADMAEARDPKPKVKTIKILLRAKGHEDFKLEVRPETTFGKIANAFRTKYRISKDQRVTLIFDGEELDSNVEMQNSEVEEMDVIEVHIN